MQDFLNSICSLIIGMGIISGVGVILWNIFGPASHGFSWLDAGAFAVVLAIIGYAVTKKQS